MTKSTALEKQRSLSSPSGNGSKHIASIPRGSLQTSKEYVARAQHFADARVLETLELYHSNRAAASFTSEDYSNVDRSQWKLVKGGSHHHAIACYKRVSSKASLGGRRIPLRTKHSQYATDGMRGTKTASKSMLSATISQQAELLAIGVVPGTLEDVLHGTVNLTPEAMQIESSHAQCDLLDSRVLSALVLPSVSAPFRSLTLKWALRHHGMLSRHRDYVYLEATGVLRDAQENNARVGYYLVHSVSLPSAPELVPEMQIVRGRMSYCYLYRQYSTSEAELFFHGGMLPRGGAKDRLAFQIMMDAVLMSPSTIECAMMKKLAYALRTKQPAALRASTLPLHHKENDIRLSQRTRLSNFGKTLFRASWVTLNSSRSSVILGRSLETTSCRVCQRPIRTFLGGKVVPCELCKEFVCHHCSVPKKIFVFESGVFNPRRMKFCVECMVTTSQLNAGWVASQGLISSAYQLRLSERNSLSEDKYGNKSQNGLGSSQLGSIDKDRGTETSEALMRQTTPHSVVWLPTDHLLSYPTSIESMDVPIKEEGQGYTQLQHDSFIDTEAFVMLDDDKYCLDEVIPMIEISSEDEEDERESGNTLSSHAVDFVDVPESS